MVAEGTVTVVTKSWGVARIRTSKEDWEKIDWEKNGEVRICNPEEKFKLEVNPEKNQFKLSMEVNDNGMFLYV